MSIGPTTLAALAKFDTPTICNAVELFGIRPPTAGYMDRRVQACFPELPPMVGFASTATFRSASPPSPRDLGAVNSKRQLDLFATLPGPPVVVFQDLDDPPAGATFGDGMCLTYKSFGAVGLITSGAARDLDNVRALDFPCFAGGAICGHGYCRVEAVHVTVHVAGLTVYPGDLLHGDRNGVTNIPPELASEVPDVCAEFLQHESVVLDNLRRGNATLASHQAALDQFRELMGGLRRRLQATARSTTA
jgi:regulator of RNase E activity RraA